MSLINLFKRKKKVFEPLKLTVELTINSQQELNELSSVLLNCEDVIELEDSTALERLFSTLRKELIED